MKYDFSYSYCFSSHLDNTTSYCCHRQLYRYSIIGSNELFSVLHKWRKEDVFQIRSHLMVRRMRIGKEDLHFERLDLHFDQRISRVTVPLNTATVAVPADSCAYGEAWLNFHALSVVITAKFTDLLIAKSFVFNLTIAMHNSKSSHAYTRKCAGLSYLLIIFDTAFSTPFPPFLLFIQVLSARFIKWTRDKEVRRR